MCAKLGSHQRNPHSKASLENRLRRVIEQATVTPSGCIESDRTPSSAYPMIGYNGRNYNVHQLLMQYADYDLTGKVIMHTCDNPRCIYPAHLTVGSQSD